MAALTTYARPGVYVTETLLGPTPAPVTTSPSTCGFTGEHWWGIPGLAVPCYRWSDFVKYFGGFNSNSVPVLSNPYLAFSVYSFFLNGGQLAYVNRITSTAIAGTAASLTLVDSESATPQNTLELTAGYLGQSGSVGTAGNNLYADVIAGSASGRFGLNIYNGGYANQYLVESWPDMSMNPTDYRYVLAIINSKSSGSLYVYATNLSDPAGLPQSTPALVSGAQFSGGTDSGSPSVTDRSNAVTIGTSPFDKIPGVLNFNMPGESDTSVLDAALNYADVEEGGRPFTFCVVDPPSGETPAAAISFFQSLSPTTAYAAGYYPWVEAQDPSSPNLQTTRLLPPGGSVLGQMVSVDTASGPWVAPGGTATVLANVVNTEESLSPTDLGTLNLANVNALRTMPNGQVVIWGVRTFEAGYASLYVPVRRTLNYIEASLESLLEPMVFAPNDSITWATVVASCSAFLGGLLTAGAFPSATASGAYYVTCDDTNNTAQSIAQGILNVLVGVALIYPAEFIALSIQQFQSTGATTVSVSS